MSFLFINDAVAATSGAADSSQGSMATIFMLVAFFAIFYFLLIRPQTKRQKEHQSLVNSLQKGDEVVTSGGILGRIAKIDENIITLALNESVEIKVQKNAISSVLPKGTLKG